MRCRSCAPLPKEVRLAADLLERRWTVSILYVSLEGAVRFNEFLQALGSIPPATLTQRLADLDDVPAEVREAMTFHPVMTIGEVLDLALEPKQNRLHAV